MAGIMILARINLSTMLLFIRAKVSILNTFYLSDF